MKVKKVPQPPDATEGHRGYIFLGDAPGRRATPLRETGNRMYYMIAGLCKVKEEVRLLSLYLCDLPFRLLHCHQATRPLAGVYMTERERRGLSYDTIFLP